MDPAIGLLALVAGYLIGSFSFARLVARLVVPDKDIADTRIDLPATEERVPFESVSATAVSLHAGARYGCLTSILDMAKVAGPTLAIRIWRPDAPYFLITAGAGMLGHVWPVYYSFRGARGLSAAYGALWVIDWPGVLATSMAGMVFGLIVFRDTLVIATVSLWFVIPWLWFRTHDGWYLLWGVLVNVVYMVTMMPEIRQYVRLRKEGKGSELTSAMQSSVGEDILRVVRKLGILRGEGPPAGSDSTADLETPGEA